ncbi:MAG TPA: HypC/HybG/HupF family hydrogenase formation chaperone [Ktedonobacterales bacterium]|jgi:hydrogenase assembly chaperone HypC/HupF|nr:HypC/HybG/HupF family hydrogenase formation chaperone [Ktedonobacterales bacterium]
MCVELPGQVTALNGALAEVESGGERSWFNALAQPDVQVGDWVSTHANLIVAILSAEEAQQMIDLAAEMDELLTAWEQEMAGASVSSPALRPPDSAG